MNFCSSWQRSISRYQEHSNKNDYIYDYNKFKEILKKKYGKPSESNIFWKNKTYKNKPSYYGMAIAVGDLSYFSSWVTNSTKIICCLFGDNFNIYCGVEYVSKELGPLEKKQTEKRNLEKF